MRAIWAPVMTLSEAGTDCAVSARRRAVTVISPAAALPAASDGAAAAVPVVSAVCACTTPGMASQAVPSASRILLFVMFTPLFYVFDVVRFEL
jgi:hypothetical protein